jgi:hypothetical protein
VAFFGRDDLHFISKFICPALLQFQLLGKLRLEALEFEARLGYIVSLRPIWETE